MTDRPIIPVIADGDPGSVIGIRFDRALNEVQGALVGQSGNPQRSAPEIRSFVRQPCDTTLGTRLRAMGSEASTSSDRLALTHELTRIATEVSQQLLSETSEAAWDTLVIGLHGFESWETRVERRYESMCDAAVLAESTGLTVIDDFPARDLAQGGLGGPVEAYGYWLLLADRSPLPGRRWRALLHLGESATECTWLPPFDKQARREPLLASSLCAGQQLFPSLTGTSADAARAGQLGSQGRVIPELLEHWQIAGSRATDWHPDGVSALPLVYALQQHEHQSFSQPDVLATAARYIADRVASFVKYGIDHARPIGELLVMGDGAQNRLTIRWLRELLPGVTIRMLNEPERDRTILAASIACLAMLHVWQIPCVSASGGVPRVLGRLTPGSPNNWQRVLGALTANAPWLLPLREAV